MNPNAPMPALPHPLDNTLCFVLPGDRDLPSGGNLYNKYLTRALRHTGTHVRKLNYVEFAGSLPHPSSIYFVDSLLLDSMRRLEQAVPRSILIVHSLRSLDPLLTPVARDRQISREIEIFNKFSGFLVASSFSRDILLNWHNVTQPILLVPPALTVTPAASISRPTACRALLVANLIRGKAVLEFLRELADRLTATDQFTLTIVGRSDIEADYAAACLQFIARHPELRSRVRFLGTLQTSRMRQLYVQSTIFLSPSLMETYGMALAEARSFGLPILALNVGNVNTHVEPGVNGLLFDSVSDLARSFLELCHNQYQLHQLLSRAQASRQVETYSWHDAAQSLLQQLEIILHPQTKEAN